jgi:hypothetical protein
MSREEMIKVLEEIALLLELKDENPFKIKAYRAGAETIRTYPDDIVALAAANELKGVTCARKSRTVCSNCSNSKVSVPKKSKLSTANWASTPSTI